MALTFLSRFKVKPEKDAEFVELIGQMEALSATERDTLAYKFYRRDEPGAFAVFESFTDEAADVAHQKNPAAEPIIGRMLACMEGTYTREYLRDVAGSGSE